MVKFSHEQFMEKIEELFAANGYKKEITFCVNICSKIKTHTCRECPISKKNSGLSGNTNLSKYFPILERKLKLKKLLES